MKRLFQKKKDNNKGFTLVEVIVVLVILAILAAVSIPALTGFISESNKKSYVAEARTAYVACQAYTTEAMKSAKKTNTEIQTEFNDKAITACPDKFKAYMEGSYTEDATNPATVKSVTISTSGKITEFKYSVSGTTVTITPGSGTVVA